MATKHNPAETDIKDSTLRVLMVEDSEDDAFLVLRSLRKYGYSPVYDVVDSRDRFEAALREQTWDAVISDYVLPEFSGLQALQLMKEKRPDMPCIIVSGRITDEIAVGALRAGATDYVLKDNLSRLGPAVDRALEESRKNLELRKAREKLLKYYDELEQKVYERTAELDRANRQMENEIKERRKAEKALVKANETLEYRVKERTQDLERTALELAEVNEQLKEYSNRITQAQEEERKRIAFELHDDTAQYLSILKLQLDSLLESPKIQDPEVLEKLKYLVRDAERAVDDIRRFSHELRPGVLDYLGLQAALEQIAEDTNKLSQVNIAVNAEGDEPDLSDDIKLSLFRIAQEVLNNARKHSGASQVNLDLQFIDRRVIMTICDNGTGFRVEEAATRAAKNGSLGLMSIQERAKLIGADLRIDSCPGQGTTVRVELAL